MKDKYHINLILRLFKNNELTINEALTDILEVFSNSKRFNSANFLAGMGVGAMIMAICIAITM